MPVACALAVAPLPQWVSGGPSTCLPAGVHEAAGAVWESTGYVHVMPPIGGGELASLPPLLLLHAAASARRAAVADHRPSRRGAEGARPIVAIEVISNLPEN
jgi:hypothetical protein